MKKSPSKSSIKSCCIGNFLALLSLVSVIVILLYTGVPAQQPADVSTQETGVEGTGGQAPPGAVELSAIFQEADETLKSASQMVKDATSISVETPDLDQTRQRIAASFKEIEKQKAQKILDIGDINRALEEWQGEAKRNEETLQTLSEGIKKVEKAKADLAGMQSKWRKTHDAYESAGLGSALDKINSVLESLRQQSEILDQAIKSMVDSQQTVSAENSAIKDHLEYLKNVGDSLAQTRWRKDRPSVFDGEFYSSFRNVKIDEFHKKWNNYYSDFKNYILQVSGKFALELMAVLLLWLWLRTVLGKIGERAEEVGGIEEMRALFRRPFSIALLAVSVPASLVHPSAPFLIREFFYLLILFPVILLLIQLIGDRNFRDFILGMGIIFVIGLVREFFTASPPLDRVILIFQAAFAITITAVTLAPPVEKEDREKQAGKRTLVWLRRAQWLLITALAVALLVQLAGYNGASVVLSGYALQTVYVSLAVFAAYRLLRSFAVFFIVGKSAQKLRIFREKGLFIINRSWRWLARLAAIAWIYLFVRIWNVDDVVFKTLYRIIRAGVKIGNTRISIGIFLGACLALYLSILLARLICFVLDEEVYPRSDVQPGLRGMINQGVRYILVFSGFVIFLSMLGVRLQSLAIVAGAFGVGIGFGLQNIVNNFLSGLIMLAERPIKIGDVLEIEGQWGTVKRIGIRATLIETWDLSEIIVPNGDILWSKLINWSHTSGRNRIHVQIGVEYGTDPETVLDILRRIALDHPEVMNNPEPVAFFMGFGDSSLDFELRCFIPSIDGRFRVASELRVAVYNALDEAGIAIPFPQRDVHIKNPETAGEK